MNVELVEYGALADLNLISEGVYKDYGLKVPVNKSASALKSKKFQAGEKSSISND